MNNFGYLIIISNSEYYRYDLMAILLAQTIKKTQAEGFDNVAVVTDSKTHIDLFKGLPYFDKVIFWNEKTFWDGRSWMDELTPWENTVCLDTDMLFFRDTSHWIKHFIKNDYLHICNNVIDFRGNPITSTLCRKTFVNNDLPNLYSAYTFFKKDDLRTKDFFNLGREIITNPKEFKNCFLDKDIPAVVGTDEAFGLAAKILDIESQISYNLSFPKFTHLKTSLQEGLLPTNNISRDLGYYFTPNSFKVGVFEQTEILHYAEKDLDIVSMIEMNQKLFIQKFKDNHVGSI